MIGFHLLYYSYNKNKLVNFRPEGDLITDEEMNKNAGLYYKFRTRSSNVPTMEVEAFVKKMLEENLPPSIQLHISTLQEDIHQAQAIENNMKGIILFFSFVSLIITLLGVYSAITLDTERRQKEVAIRKVNGAGLKQIIILFARTYIYQLVLSATMAFPLCYAILQLWKNMYIVFFNDGPLFWISIFIIVAVITTLTIIFRILKIARTNPAEVIKNE